MPRGRSWPVKGRIPIAVRFGPPLHLGPDEGFVSFSRRIKDTLARLADEEATTWWESLRRQAEGKTPSMSGPEGPKWRRVWEASKPPPRRGKAPVWPR